MRVFVTGATGFLGSHLVKQLVAAGYDVRGLVYEPDRMGFVRGLGAEPVQGGLDDVDALRDAMQGCDGVFHVAGYVSLYCEGERSRAINVQGTRNALKAARDAGVRRVVHVSSEVTVGATLDGTLVDEDTRFQLDHLGLAYVDTKRAGEQEALSFTEDLEVVVVNPGGIMGPDDAFGSAGNKLVGDYLDGKLSVSLRVRNNWVDVRDVAAGMILAFEKGRSGERYLLTGENCELNDILGILDEQTGLGRPKITLRYPLTAVLGFVMQWFGDEPPLTPQLARFFRHAFWSRNDKARQELGFDPRPLRETVADTLTWRREQHA